MANKNFKPIFRFLLIIILWNFLFPMVYNTYGKNFLIVKKIFICLQCLWSVIWVPVGDACSFNFYIVTLAYKCEAKPYGPGVVIDELECVPYVEKMGIRLRNRPKRPKRKASGRKFFVREKSLDKACRDRWKKSFQTVKKIRQSRTLTKRKLKNLYTKKTNMQATLVTLLKCM